MLIKGVDIPETVLRAQKAGNLVVFAGAGVSMPSPSNLPNFDDLAAEVAGAALQREDGEPVDHFLGRLDLHGVKVHERVHRILTAPASTPNSLHFDILRLFTSPSDVRLVTTNFDRHFTTAAQSLFGVVNLPEVHFAPALPLGHRFAGMIYMHGSVDRPPERLVLTDADFGRAYLTEGWARTFLERLFGTHVVLFVGYSHGDPVVSYLARGLAPETSEPRRFALTEAGRDEYWRYLGIVPVPYALGSVGEKHAQLRTVLTAWADLAGLGALDQEQKIKTIVEQEFPVAPEDEDYVRQALLDVATARFFTEHAKSVGWLRWAEAKGFLDQLFQPAPQPDEIGRELAVWFARKFVCEHPGTTLAVVQRKGGRLNPTLWLAIAHRLWTNDSATDSTALSKWVAVLTRSHPTRDRSRLLDYILTKFAIPGNETLALHLFEELARPTLAMKKDIWKEIERKDEGEDVAFDLTSTGDEFYFVETWRKYFQPHLDSLADRLVPIVTAHLSQAHLLLRLVGKADDNWDPLSFSRQSIQSPPPVPYENALETLIDAARELIRWYTEHNSTRADTLIDLWSSSACPILERLATFAVAISTSWASDRKLEWALRSDLLYARGRRNETFLLLKNSYPSAREQLRAALLERVLRGPDPKIDETTRAYEIYNLLHWLNGSAPECPLARAQLEAFASKHPRFRPREHPDLDVVFGPVRVGWVSPISAKELVSKAPEEQIEFLLSFEPTDLLGPDREGLTRALSEAVSNSHSWGVRFARALDGSAVQRDDIWQAIVEGWVGPDFTELEWKEILEFVAAHDKLLNAAGPQVSRMLEKGFAEPTRGIPDSLVRPALALTERLWKLCVLKAEPPRQKAEDWYFLAINYPGGTLARLLLELIDRVRRDVGDKWDGIPREFYALLDSVVLGDSSAAELGRVILASRIHFLFAVDRNWAIKKIVPLLDQRHGSKQALQAWHGYLAAGTWNEELLEHLMPLYRLMFPLVHTEHTRFCEAFCGHLAGIACFSVRNPLTDGWLNQFLQQTTLQERKMWASSIEQAIKQIKEPAKRKIWDIWLRDYWDRRIDGIPLPLDSEEVTLMISWVPYLGPASAEAVNRVLASPPPKLPESSFLFYELSGSEMPTQQPQPTAKLLLHVVRSGLGPRYDYQQFEDVFNRIAPAADQGTLTEICDQLANLGYQGASRLRASIKRTPSAQ